jgi:hypothetical protein
MQRTRRCARPASAGCNNSGRTRTRRSSDCFMTASAAECGRSPTAANPLPNRRTAVRLTYDRGFWIQPGRLRQTESRRVRYRCLSSRSSVASCIVPASSVTSSCAAVCCTGSKRVACCRSPCLPPRSVTARLRWWRTGWRIAMVSPPGSRSTPRTATSWFLSAISPPPSGLWFPTPAATPWPASRPGSQRRWRCSPVTSATISNRYPLAWCWSSTTTTVSLPRPPTPCSTACWRTRWTTCIWW